MQKKKSRNHQNGTQDHQDITSQKFLDRWIGETTTGQQGGTTNRMGSSRGGHRQNTRRIQTNSKTGMER